MLNTVLIALYTLSHLLFLETESYSVTRLAWSSLYSTGWSSADEAFQVLRFQVYHSALTHLSFREPFIFQRKS